MERKHAMPSGLAIIGFLYGVLLGSLSLVAAGAGHGTYVLVGVSSAPLGALGIIAALVGGPVLWATLGWLLGQARSRKKRLAFLVIVVGHYLGAAALLATPSFGDWQHFQHVFDVLPWVIVGWGVAYAGGQLGLWAVFCASAKQRAPG